MPKTKDLKMDEYDIGQALYRELMWFCLQYKEKQSKLRACYSLSAVQYKSTPSGGGVSDPTVKAAERAEIYKADIDMIETIARLACPYQTNLFLRTVTEQHTTYETIRMAGFKMSRHDFNKKRRYFYYMLAVKLKKI